MAAARSRRTRGRQGCTRPGVLGLGLISTFLADCPGVCRPAPPWCAVPVPEPVCIASDRRLNPDAAPDHRLVFRPPAVPNNFRPTDNYVTSAHAVSAVSAHPDSRFYSHGHQPGHPSHPTSAATSAFFLDRCARGSSSPPPRTRRGICSLRSALSPAECMHASCSRTLIAACDPMLVPDACMRGCRPPRPPEPVAGPSGRPARAGRWVPGRPDDQLAVRAGPGRIPDTELGLHGARPALHGRWTGHDRTMKDFMQYSIVLGLR